MKGDKVQLESACNDLTTNSESVLRKGCVQILPLQQAIVGVSLQFPINGGLYNANVSLYTKRWGKGAK